LYILNFLCIFPQVAENSIIEVGLSTGFVHQELRFPVELLGCPIREMGIPIVLVYKELGFPSERWDPLIEVGIPTGLVHKELGCLLGLFGCLMREVGIPIVLVYKELEFPLKRWDPHRTCPQGAGIPSRTTWVSHEENGDPHCPCV
jgi:hypothetical protein